MLFFENLFHQISTMAPNSKKALNRKVTFGGSNIWKKAMEWLSLSRNLVYIYWNNGFH